MLAPIEHRIAVELNVRPAQVKAAIHDDAEVRLAPFTEIVFALSALWP